MKRICRILAAMSIAIMSAGALAGCVGDVLEEEGAESVDEAEQALAPYPCTTHYYSDASMTVEVGYCILASICTWPRNQCTGTITPYKTIECDVCP